MVGSGTLLREKKKEKKFQGLGSTYLCMSVLKDWILIVAGKTDAGREFALELIGTNLLTNVFVQLVFTRI